MMKINPNSISLTSLVKGPQNLAGNLKILTEEGYNLKDKNFAKFQSALYLISPEDFQTKLAIMKSNGCSPMKDNGNVALTVFAVDANELEAKLADDKYRKNIDSAKERTNPNSRVIDNNRTDIDEVVDSLMEYYSSAGSRNNEEESSLGLGRRAA